ncbi:MAG: heat-inducible transcriptional repressor HrcA [Propionibacteriaceae bacterium]|nr:heat-inducible transcriptional repressor HrcA [Propionibacteriaceae bacterium]MCL2483017.1 heat-inducible transcriptional repressor HrcA [Propionibacteriaceae bacterium]
MLDDRKLAVLRAIVTDYVRSREPVGSRAIVERYHLDVSSATVRNDMAALEEEGYIAQPHTSAGRIPTDKGYRFFVDRLAAMKPLTNAEKRAITIFLTGAVGIDDIMTRTVRLLAQVTSQVAIMAYPTMSTAVVRRVDIVPLTASRGLLIVVNSIGKVAQRYIDLGDTGEEALATLRDRLNHALVGLGPRRAAEVLADFHESVAPEVRGITLGVVASALDILASDEPTKIVMAGINNLSQFSDEFETSIRPVLDTLEEQMVLLKLLGEASGEVTVHIGQENEHANLSSASVVATGYGVDDTWAGLGIVGPTRMDYPSTMASVRAVARYVSRILAEG